MRKFPVRFSQSIFRILYRDSTCRPTFFPPYGEGSARLKSRALPVGVPSMRKPQEGNLIGPWSLRGSGGTRGGRHTWSTRSTWRAGRSGSPRHCGASRQRLAALGARRCRSWRLGTAFRAGLVDFNSCWSEAHIVVLSLGFALAKGAVANSESSPRCSKNNSERDNKRNRSPTLIPGQSLRPQYYFSDIGF